MLILEHDELIFVECKNIEMAYMLAIGGLEYKVQLYRTVIKALHPDIHNDLNEAMVQLFNNAVMAYKNGDINGLRMIGAMVGKPTLPEDTPDTMMQMIKENERLSKLLETIKDRITEIKSKYPYTMKKLLESPKKTAARKSEIEESISQLYETLSTYTAKIESIVRQLNG